MMRVLAQSILIISGVFFLCIGLIRAQPYDTAELRHLLGETPDCPRPCWQGIRPGSTSLDEALSILRAHDWIRAESVRVVDHKVQWEWSGQQPARIDSSAPGALYISADRVFSLTIPLTVGMGDLQLLYGAPRWSSRGRYQYEAFIQYAYPREYVTLLIRVDCPMMRESYWHARPQVTLSSGLMRGASYTPQSSYIKLC